MDSSSDQPPQVEVVTKAPQTSKTPLFQVGEMLPWKGCWFKVKEVKEHELTLEVVGWTSNRKEKYAKDNKEK